MADLLDPLYAGNGRFGTGLDYQHSDNPMYEAYYAANPYVGQTYKKTLIDRIFGGAFRTGYDKWRDEMAVNAAQYDAGIVDLQQQNQYNSEEAKAMRMRAAGENPDLLGTADVADAANTNPDPQDAQIPEAETTQMFDLISNVGQTVIDLVPKTMGFITSLKQLKGISMDNDLKELQFGSNAVDFANKFFSETLTKQDYEDAYSTGNFENLLDAAEKDSDYLVSTFLSSDKARKAFKLAYGTHARSLIGELSKYNTYDEYEKARKSVNTQRASSYWSADDSMQVKLISALVVPFEQYQKKMLELNQRLANMRNPELEQGTINSGLRAEKAYNDAYDGSLAAQADNAENDYQKQVYEIYKQTDELFSTMMSNLDALGDDWYVPLAKALVGIARSQLLSGIHMQFGRSSSSYTNSSTGAQSDFNSFNFGF